MRFIVFDAFSENILLLLLEVFVEAPLIARVGNQTIVLETEGPWWMPDPRVEHQIAHVCAHIFAKVNTSL